MRLTLFCLVIFISLVSCKKDMLDVNSYWQCHYAQNLDSTAISNKLVGSWIWTKQSCNPAEEAKAADKNIKLTIKADHSFTVMENSTNISQGSWSLVQKHVNEWELETSSPSQYLAGRLLFCDNQVLFNFSYVDGCDNLFNKIN